MQIFAGNATIATSHDGAKPNVAIVNRDTSAIAILHLTRHRAPIIAGRRRSNSEASAIHITGTVPVVGEPREDVSVHTFHFLQLIFESVCTASYAGIEQADGSIVMNLAEEKPRFMLDSDESSAPFVNDESPSFARFGKTIVSASTGMDDHPNQSLSVIMPNPLTGKSNYLIALQKSLELYSIFVMRDMSTAKATIQPLAHVHWTINWDVEIKWQMRSSGEMIADASATGEMVVGNGTKGSLPDPKLAAMVTDPPTETWDMYNPTTNATVKRLVGSTANNKAFQAARHWDARMFPHASFVHVLTGRYQKAD
jgi:hypothetical protein